MAQKKANLALKTLFAFLLFIFETKYSLYFNCFYFPFLRHYKSQMPS